MFKRIFAIFRARNVEFVRDRSTLAWNIVLPVALVFGLSAMFGGADRSQYTVGVLQGGSTLDTVAQPFLATRYVDFVVLADRDAAVRKVSRQQLDLLVEFMPDRRYWVNPASPKGYFAERLLLQAAPGMVKAEIAGSPITYVDWVLPGILGMNMMFSCLFGVGYVIVRYRKNGFLKRLRATPLRAIEFVIAQVASRLVLILSITVFIFSGTEFFLHTRMEGSLWLLLLIAMLGAVSLISLGVLVAARVTSEELAGGLLNMATWPMMMLSGVWFSLEAAEPWVRHIATVFPLTHVLHAARAVMLDGAGLAAVWPDLAILCAMSLVFLTLGATLFRWRPH